jgi:hypothetical protein
MHQLTIGKTLTKYYFCLLPFAFCLLPFDFREAALVLMLPFIEFFVNKPGIPGFFDATTFFRENSLAISTKECKKRQSLLQLVHTNC